jgi:hypothetical protein
MFPIVAVGQLGPASTRKWLPMVAAAVAAIVLHKPLVALILAAGFTQLSSGESLVDVVRGFVTLALSVIALPAMLRICADAANTQMPGLEKLLPSERLLAVRADSLVAMDAAANSSKGERSWAAWRQASFFYSEETIRRMAAQESELFAEMQSWISATVVRR